MREWIGKVFGGLMALVALGTIVGGGALAYAVHERDRAETRREEVDVRVREHAIEYMGYVGETCRRGGSSGGWLTLSCVIVEEAHTRGYGHTSRGSTEIRYREKVACSRGQWSVELVTPSPRTSVVPIQGDGCTFGWAVRHDFPEIPPPNWIPAQLRGLVSNH